MNKRVFVSRVLGMSGVMLFLNISDMCYNVFISKKAGADGIAVFHLIMSIFSFFSCVAVSGMGLTSTRLISDMPSPLAVKCADGVVIKCLRLSFVPASIACIVLYLASGFFSENILNVSYVQSSFKILAPCLLCMAASSVLNGYFTAFGAVGAIALGRFVREAVVWSVTLVVFYLKGTKNAYEVIVYAFSAGAICECACDFCLWKRMKTRLYCNNGTNYKSILYLCVPIALGSYLRTGLSSVENILVPSMLVRFGSENPLEIYGVVKGMVMPLLMFPTVLSGAFTSFIVPEIATRRAMGYHNGIRYITRLSLEYILKFAFFISAVFFRWHREIAMYFYSDIRVARYLGMLCVFPLFWFLDSVTDAILKGLNHQLTSLKINIVDSLCRVVFVFVLIPYFGIEAYIFIICVSEVINFLFSYIKLKREIHISFPFKNGIIASILSVLICIFISGLLPGFNLWAEICIFAMCYLVFQYLLSGVFKEKEYK